MCSFATRSNIEFGLTMLRFVSAQAGLLAPHPDFPTRAVNPARGAREPAGGCPIGRHPFRRPFNLSACFTMVEPIDIPERVVEVRT